MKRQITRQLRQRQRQTETCLRHAPRHGEGPVLGGGKVTPFQALGQAAQNSSRSALASSASRTETSLRAGFKAGGGHGLGSSNRVIGGGQ